MKNKFAASCCKCGKLVDAGAGETNKVDGKWKTEHLTVDACKAAAPTQRRAGASVGGGYFGMVGYMNDYYDDYDNPYGEFGTSEDVNPLEGCK